jgi:hypothetical protein
MGRSLLAKDRQNQAAFGFLARAGTSVGAAVPGVGMTRTSPAREAFIRCTSRTVRGRMVTGE